MNSPFAQTHTSNNAISINKVLKNTYILLGMTAGLLSVNGNNCNHDEHWWYCIDCSYVGWFRFIICCV